MSKLRELGDAKKNVKWLLDNPEGLVDMHGLVYWAEVVERVRKEINEMMKKA